MKTNNCLLLSFLLITLTLQAQGWVQQSNARQVLDLEFINEQSGWAVGADAFRTTTDGGLNWELRLETKIREIISLDFVTSQTGWLLAYTRETGRKILLKTTDGGETWEELSLADLDDYAKLDFVNSTTGWMVGQFGKILKTTNGGVSWTLQSSTVLVHLNDVHFSDLNNGWAAGNSSQVLRTMDGGITWVKINNQFNNIFYNINTLFVLDENHLWVSGLGGDILGTADGGENWFQWEPPTYSTFEDIHFTDEINGWAIGDNGIYATYDGGLNWEGIAAFTGKNIYFRDELNGFITTDYPALNWTNDGGITWSGVASYNYYDAFDFLPSGVVIAVSQYTGFVGKSASTGQVFDFESSSLGISLWKCHRVNENLGFVIGSQPGLTATSYSVLYKTEDGGQTLTPVYKTRWSINDIYAVSEEEIYIVGEDHEFLGSPNSEGFVAKSTNGGESFVFLHQHLDFDIGHIHYKNDDHLLFAGTNTIGTITNGGQNITPTTTLDNFIVGDISVVDDDHIFFLAWDTSVDQQKIVSTVDGGISWNSHFLEEYFDDIHFTSPSEGWAVDNNKFYRSQDGGLNWQLSSYLGNDANTLDIQNGGKVWAGGNGIYFYDDVTPTEDSYVEEVRVKIWPNPAVDQLNLTLPKSVSWASAWPDKEQPLIQLYNTTGQIVATWAPDDRDVILDIGRLPAGVYWLRCTTKQGEVRSEKIIITH